MGRSRLQNKHARHRIQQLGVLLSFFAICFFNFVSFFASKTYVPCTDRFGPPPFVRFHSVAAGMVAPHRYSSSGSRSKMHENVLLSLLSHPHTTHTRTRERSRQKRRKRDTEERGVLFVVCTCTSMYKYPGPRTYVHAPSTYSVHMCTRTVYNSIYFRSRTPRISRSV